MSGNDRGFGPLDSKLLLLGTALAGKNLRRITRTVALDAKRDVMGAVVRELGGDRKMSHWRVKFGAGFELLDDHTAKVTPRPGGPWAVLDRGRKPGSKFSRKRKRNVGWGATSGRYTWSRAAMHVEQETPERVHREVVRTLREVFTKG